MKTATQISLLLLLLAASCGPKEEPGDPGGDPKPESSKKIEPTGTALAKARDAGAPASEETPAPEPPEGMVLVPGGTFTMGLDHPRAIPDEKTEHEVTVAPFFLDRTEVTNAAYTECVEAGVCRKPAWKDTKKAGFEPLERFRTPDRPVSAVSRKDAATYCEWRGKRLPTEAEFERAARGDDGRMYAWGNEEPDRTRAVYELKVTAPVGSKPDGAGPYGHLDLSGNVWEWTSDLYDPLAYERETAPDGLPGTCPQIRVAQDELRRDGKQGYTGTNPIPTDCDHVLRGGAFNYFPWGLRASNRVHHPGSWRMIMAGFRCAGDTESEANKTPDPGPDRQKTE